MITIETVLEKLALAFSVEDYESADKLLRSAKQVPELYNETTAIYDANIALMQNDYPRMWEAIRTGLSLDNKNYGLYNMLGEYYRESNPDQTYLCFEQALFYCTNEDEKLILQEKMEELKRDYTITVRPVSFIILSYNLLNYTRTCIESIRETVPADACEIVIVDNASTDGSVEWLRTQTDIVLRENKENRGFPGGCNDGVAVASKENDIMLLNNDTQLLPNAIFWLRMGLYENDKVGSTGCKTNHCSNAQLIASLMDADYEELVASGLHYNLPCQYPYEAKIYLVGFALLIKRSVYDLVGDLDEQFSPGNYEDNDYGLRILHAGYQNILCKNSFIIHFGSKSFGKEKKTFSNILFANMQKFKAKWGFDVNYYFYPRAELLRYVKEDNEQPLNILDIGCGCGALLAHLKGLYPNMHAHGIEIVPKVAEVANHFANVICADVEQLEFPWPEEYFDYVIMGDVLEHLHEPSVVLKRLYPHIKKGGHIIVSMPNVKHYSVMLPLIMRDVFPYENAGILDTTHLKMYTKHEIAKLIIESGYHLKNYDHTTFGTPTEAENCMIDTLVSLSESKDRSVYLAYQYIMHAIK